MGHARFGQVRGGKTPPTTHPTPTPNLHPHPSENLEKMQENALNLAKNLEKRRKNAGKGPSPENAGKCGKSPENARTP